MKHRIQSSTALVPIAANSHPIRIGTLAGLPEHVVSFSSRHLFGDGHLAIYGGTGKGKSKMAEHILRQVLHQQDAPGGVVIDPHGELVESLLLYIEQCPERINPRIVKNLHYIELEGSHSFSLDPFDPLFYRNVRPERHPAWLQAQAERVALGIIRMRGEYSLKGMAQLERYLKTFLVAAGTPIDDQGSHLPLSDIDILYTPQHPDYQDVYDLIAPRLTRTVRRELDQLRALRPDKYGEAINSTINRLNSFFSELVRPIFACQRPSIDLPSIIDNQGWLFVNLASGNEAGQGQADAVGSILLRMLVDEVSSRKRQEDRRPFIVWIDEASRYVGDDVIKMLRENRKHGLSCCLCVQDLDALDTDEVKMARQVTSLCEHQFTFQQRNEDDMLRLASVFALPNLNFEKLRTLSNLTVGQAVVELFDQQVGVDVSRHIIEGGSLTVSEAERLLRGVRQAETIEHSRGERLGTQDMHLNETDESTEVSQGLDVAVGIDRQRATKRAKSTSSADTSLDKTVQGSSESLETALEHHRGEESQVANTHEDYGSTGVRRIREQIRATTSGERSGEGQEDSNARISGEENVRDRTSTRDRVDSHLSRKRVDRRNDGDSVSSSLDERTSQNLHRRGDSSRHSDHRSEEQRHSERRYGESYQEESTADREGIHEYEEQGQSDAHTEVAVQRTGTTDRKANRNAVSQAREVGTAHKEALIRSEEESDATTESKTKTRRQSLSEKFGKRTGQRHTDSREELQGTAHSRQLSEEQSRSLEHATARAQQWANQEGVTEKIAETTKQVLMALQPIVSQDTGSLRDILNDQMYKCFQTMRLLSVAQVMHIEGNSRSYIIEVDEVTDARPIIDLQERRQSIDRIKHALISLRPYYFVPVLGAAGEQARLSAWLTRHCPYLMSEPVSRPALPAPRPTPQESRRPADKKSGFEI